MLRPARTRFLKALKLILPVLVLVFLGDVRSFADEQAIADQDALALETTTLAISDPAAAVDKVISLGNPTSQRDVFVASLKVAQNFQGGIIDKVWDKTYGTTLRQIIYMVSQDGKGTIYFRFNFKRWPKGWVLSNFAFDANDQQMFPPDWPLIP